MGRFDGAAISGHARLQMARRGIGEAEVRAALADPEDVIAVRPGRVVVHRRFRDGDPPRSRLLRVFVDVDRSPPEVVTAYRTSRVAKYRRPS